MTKWHQFFTGMPYNEKLIEGKSLRDQLSLALNGFGKKKKVIAKIMGWNDSFWLFWRI